MSEHNPAICTEGDGQPCLDCAERIENEGIEKVYQCPWCDKWQSMGEIRVCSGYQPRYSTEELRDCYSDPTEAAKLESMLRQADQESFDRR